MPVDNSNYNNSSSHQKLGYEQSGLKRKTSDATTNTNDHQEVEEGEGEEISEKKRIERRREMHKIRIVIE